MDVIQRAKDAGVVKMMVTGSDFTESQQAVKMAETYRKFSLLFNGGLSALDFVFSGVEGVCTSFTFFFHQGSIALLISLLLYFDLTKKT